MDQEVLFAVRQRVGQANERPTSFRRRWRASHSHNFGAFQVEFVLARREIVAPDKERMAFSTWLRGRVMHIIQPINVRAETAPSPL